MARRCDISGKAVLTGNKVSHSNRKSRKRFLPNLQSVSLLSDVLARRVRMRITPNALRSIEINGGLDAYLLSTRDNNLAPEAVSIKKIIKKTLANQQV